ncbi:MAG: rRNA maturation RNase YbeY [Actinomycetota bacterium]|nr:rRNA maturation RNase YbeY [Actinomycetota bacterium]
MNAEPPKPTVALSDRQDLPVEPAPLRELAVRTLLGEGVDRGELSVSLVGRDEIARLHERYMDEPGPTDVLSFPQDDDGPPGEPRLLGDVVICPEVAAAQSGDLDAELRLLLVHGILHLLGYDHEDDDGRAAMWARQERYSGVRA